MAFPEPERAVLNRFTKELRAACGRQINHFVSASASDLEPRQGPERSMSVTSSEGETPERTELATFLFLNYLMIEKLIRGHSMPNPPASLSHESLPKSAPGSARHSRFAGTRYGSVSSRRPALDGRPGKLHPSDRIAGRGAIHCGRGATRCAPGHAQAIADLHKVGTLATVHKVVRMPNQSRFVFTEGVSRVRLVRFIQSEPFMVAEVETLEDLAPATSAGVRGAGAQRDRPVPADRRRIAHALRRAADHRGEHRRTLPAWWILWRLPCPF